MEIRIGIQNVAREIAFETDMSKDDVTEKVRAAVNDGTNLELTDNKGGTVVVPAGVLGYVEIGDASARRVGFVAG
ncbi:DUF3107 domain-containing protein [Yaniella halotolerans]|uniref:DUF3107 domain-containing protein n=1 Tax=Yaniella halotolerans TaxID=225453 RepID=UPI0003B6651B|nr:DUF3107 domain-containing protein [Yaniella halotolerans]